MTSKRVFVVTGGNKGIGKSIVKLLLQENEEKIVYLTSRNIDLGKKAVEDLESIGLCPYYHQLDITDKKSIEKLRDHLKAKHDGLDVLVNNAGIACGMKDPRPLFQQASETLSCNFFGTLNVCEILFPLLKENARVCNVSSTVSEFSFKKFSVDLQEKFKNKNLTVDGLKVLMSEYITAAYDGDVIEKGWSKSTYGVSKVGVSILTHLLQEQLNRRILDMNILVNCCCPGVVDTDLTSYKHDNALTPDKGADTCVYLALLPVDMTEPMGCYLKCRQVHSFPPI